MPAPIRVITLVIVGTFLIVAGFIFFTVDEKHQALVLQFGDPVGGAINEPGSSEAGLKLKLPWQNVVEFDRRNLEFDSDPVEIIVRNEERLLVDAFVRYQIVDPLLYYQSLGAGGGNATLMRDQLNRRLTQILEEAIRERLSTRTIREIIDQQRAEIMREVTSDVTDEARKLGIRTIDVRIRQADFPAANAENVNRRMSSDYNQQAELIRAQGEERAREIRAEANKEVIRVKAEAEERAQIIRGRADAVRNCIFANAYQGVAADIQTVEPAAEVEAAGEGVEAPPAEEVDFETELAQMLGVSCRITGTPGDGDPSRREFFAFYRSLLAYEQSLGGEQDSTTIILSPDSEFFQYFKNQSGRD